MEAVVAAPTVSDEHQTETIIDAQAIAMDSLILDAATESVLDVATKSCSMEEVVFDGSLDTHNMAPDSSVVEHVVGEVDGYLVHIKALHSDDLDNVSKLGFVVNAWTLPEHRFLVGQVYASNDAIEFAMTRDPHGPSPVNFCGDCEWRRTPIQFDLGGYAYLKEFPQYGSISPLQLPILFCHNRPHDVPVIATTERTVLVNGLPQILGLFTGRQPLCLNLRENLVSLSSSIFRTFALRARRFLWVGELIGPQRPLMQHQQPGSPTRGTQPMLTPRQQLDTVASQPQPNASSQ